MVLIDHILSRCKKQEYRRLSTITLATTLTIKCKKIINQKRMLAFSFLKTSKATYGGKALIGYHALLNMKTKRFGLYSQYTYTP